MEILIAGLVLFLGIHSVSIISDPWRNRMAARLGEWPWKGIYAVLAIAGFILIVWGYGLARQHPVAVYVPPTWMRHVTLLLMLPVFPMLLATYLPGRIQSALKHPMLAAVKLWAFAHLLANGNLADIVLFGSLLAWAVADRISLKRRVQRPVPGAPPSAANDAIAVVGGLLLYVGFIVGIHRWLIGVSPV
ncbi:MAG: NnrU family protein [Chromatiaceae bacterium]